MSGVELVERLNMGTTGQLYHHLKALLGADLITQDERGGKYLVSTDRVLPLLMLLTAVSDLLDTSDYLDMSTVRDNSGVYLGKPEAQGHDVHNLLWATLENSILEHKAGYCTEIDIFLHEDASVTVSDNGRGIPVRLLPDSNKTVVQSMLTDVHRNSVDYLVPGGEKGVSIAVVNALSQKLTIEVKKDGHVYRQEYRNGIPQTGLIVVGVTKETGTSVTFKANPELFSTRVNEKRIQEYVRVISMNYPDLSMRLYEGNLALDQSGKDGDGK
jgi:DNA gyrase subunit B